MHESVKRDRQSERLAADRDFALLHRLQQGRLRGDEADAIGVALRLLLALERADRADPVGVAAVQRGTARPPG